MYTKVLKKKENIKVSSQIFRFLFATYFTNNLYRLHIGYNVCSRQKFLPSLSIDLIYLVNVGQTNFILAQKFVPLILIST